MRLLLLCLLLPGCVKYTIPQKGGGSPATAMTFGMDMTIPSDPPIQATVNAKVAEVAGDVMKAGGKEVMNHFADKAAEAGK